MGCHPPPPVLRLEPGVELCEPPPGGQTEVAGTNANKLRVFFGGIGNICGFYMGFLWVD